MAHIGPRKDGFYSIRKHARLMCKFIQVFTPVIIKKYPESTTISALLAAAAIACEALIQEMDALAEPGV